MCANPTFPSGLGAIAVRGVGDGFLTIGDAFETTECSESGMQSAFDAFGLPTTACLFVKADGVVTEFCAPLNVVG